MTTLYGLFCLFHNFSLIFRSCLFEICNILTERDLACIAETSCSKRDRLCLLFFKHKLHVNQRWLGLTLELNWGFDPLTYFIRKGIGWWLSRISRSLHFKSTNLLTVENWLQYVPFLNSMFHRLEYYLGNLISLVIYWSQSGKRIFDDVWIGIA